VELVEVDVLEPQAAQAPLAGLAEVLWPAVAVTTNGGTVA